LLTFLTLPLLGACGKNPRADDGPISSPEIIAALRGPKRGYVGAWVQSDADGAPAYLDIGPRGGIRYRYESTAPPYRKERIEGLVARFVGNDIEVSGASPGLIVVSDPPQRSGDRWQMRAMKKTFER
jgi:hypothetical protein